MDTFRRLLRAPFTNGKRRFALSAGSIFLAFIITALIVSEGKVERDSVNLIPYLFFFPFGLQGYLEAAYRFAMGQSSASPLSTGSQVLIAIGSYVPYILLIPAITFVDNLRVSRILYLILLFILIANISGCTTLYEELISSFGLY